MQGLYFSRTEPKKPLRCALTDPGWPDSDSLDVWNQPNHRGIMISVSHDLAPKIDGAVLDFGAYNRMQRFVWLYMPAVKGPLHVFAFHRASHREALNLPQRSGDRPQRPLG